jgi:riboflavin biosynthesis pyrimidine reductase
LSAARLEPLYEAGGLPTFDLPAELARLYGGGLGFDTPRLIANFVSTLDGVVAIPSLPGSNRVIAAASSADRFVMGLLRACCDAVVIGAGTLTASPTSLWTPARAFPDGAAGFAELRRRLGHARGPELVVLSASGLLDPLHPALEAGAVLLTSDLGAERLAGRLPAAARALSLGAGPTLDPDRILAELAGLGHRLILSEGGPHAIAPLLSAGLVDELFLTVSPLLIGRPGDDPRLALVEGADLLADGPSAARLLGLRRSGDHLFLRYALAGR